MHEIISPLTELLGGQNFLVFAKQGYLFPCFAKQSVTDRVFLSVHERRQSNVEKGRFHQALGTLKTVSMSGKHLPQEHFSSRGLLNYKNQKLC